MAENLLAIDCGTQSLRALIFDPQGKLLKKSRVPYEAYYSTAPGLAEQDPLVFWNALCKACQKLFKYRKTNASSIAAVSLDQRRAQEFSPVKGLWGAAFAIAGVKPTVEYLQAESEANWLVLNEPETWKQTYKFTYLSGYLVRHLTGRFVDSIGSQVGYMPFDYKKQAWAAPSHWYWQALAIEPEKLVDLIPVGEILGEITDEASEQTGIPAGLPLIAAGADKACEVLGAGSLESNVACLSYGSAATINTTHKKYVEIIPLIPPYPAAVPNYYNMELQIYRGYWMVSWFKEEFGLREQRLAKAKGIEPEFLFDDLVNSVPVGSQGLVLQPYWSPGLRHPGPEARGAIIGFNVTHTRAHIYRAILEGLAYALRDGKERTEKRSKTIIDQLRVAGGGSQSKAAMQLTADVFGLPVSRPHVYEASGLGAAINAAVGAGIHPNHHAAMKAMTHIGDTFLPNADAHAVYEALYNQVYQRMYKRLQPFYNALQGITLPTE